MRWGKISQIGSGRMSIWPIADSKFFLLLSLSFPLLRSSLEVPTTPITLIIIINIVPIY